MKLLSSYVFRYVESIKTGREKRGRETTKHDIRTNALIARLFPVYEFANVREGRNLPHSSQQIYFASKYIRVSLRIEIAIWHKALYTVTENILVFQQ